MSKYTVRKIKTFIGREGYGLNAVIYRDEKPICFVLDEADGGATRYDYRNPLQTPKSFQSTTREMADKEERDLEAYCLSILSAADRNEQDDNVYAIDTWVNTTVDEYHNKKRFDRIAKTKTLFRVKGDKAETWRTINMPYSAAVQAALDKRYPGQVETVWGRAQS